MRLLGLFSHPDDAEAWAGGTLRRHILDGDGVRVFLFHCLEPARKEEALVAAARLGTEVSFLPTAEYGLPFLQPSLDALAAEPPAVIVTHWCDDTHLEHRQVFQHALAISHYIKRHLKPAPLLLMSSSYFLSGAGGGFEPNVLCDVTDTMDDKCHALSAYVSQKPEALIEQVTLQNRILGLRIGTTYAEGFREYPLFGQSAAARRRSFRDLLGGEESSTLSKIAGKSSGRRHRRTPEGNLS